MIVDATVAEPRPEEICDPFEAYWNSSPRYLIDVISQFLPLTVNTKALLEPASTTKSSPDFVTPKAASAEEEKMAAARRADLRNMMGVEEGRSEDTKASIQLQEACETEDQISMCELTDCPLTAIHILLYGH